jgi:hypothetical protein
MSKWSRLKVAGLTATTILAGLLFSGGCLGGISLDRVIELVAVGSIFD